MPRHLSPRVVIACGGTGGHFFPGAAVGRELMTAGARVTLLVSSKSVDRQAARTQEGMDIREISAAALQRRAPWRFLSGLCRSLTEIHGIYRSDPPSAVLVMGGFTSAAPALLGWLWDVPVFLHESNAIPGRANRLLAPLACGVFAGFGAARGRFLHQSVEVTGTPVRSAFFRLDTADCRARLGLKADRPVVLVMGGSQGARSINELVCGMLPKLLVARPDLQFLHLTGDTDLNSVRSAYRVARGRAVVRAFLNDMPAALGAADVAVGRSGASSLAELAAAGVPAVLVPMPGSADDHQRHNARYYSEAYGAKVVEQSAGPAALRAAILDQLNNPKTGSLPASRDEGAATRVAARILEVVCQRGLSIKTQVAMA